MCRNNWGLLVISWTYFYSLRVSSVWYETEVKFIDTILLERPSVEFILVCTSMMLWSQHIYLLLLYPWLVPRYTWRSKWRIFLILVGFFFIRRVNVNFSLTQLFLWNEPWSVRVSRNCFWYNAVVYSLPFHIWGVGIYKEGNIWYGVSKILKAVSIFFILPVNWLSVTDSDIYSKIITVFLFSTSMWNFI